MLIKNLNAMFKDIELKLEELSRLSIVKERQKTLQPLVDYLVKKISSHEDVKLNFICTHNSRRSQFSQVWAKVISQKFGFDIESYSGGTETTAFNPRVVDSLKRFGFQIPAAEGENPKYKIEFSHGFTPIIGFSKRYDDTVNPTKSFAAVMTCSHADDNCPFIPGCESRIALNYEDPKAFDGTNQESEKYDERSKQIASEMIYVFNLVNEALNR